MSCEAREPRARHRYGEYGCRWEPEEAGRWDVRYEADVNMRRCHGELPDEAEGLGILRSTKER